MLKKNLVANYLGQGWVIIMGLAFIPLYIKYLGIEAYGLIGLYAVLRACFAIFDMGVAPTLSREMAHFTGGMHSAQYIHNLLRSIEIIMCIVAIIIILSSWLTSSYLATHWLSAETISAKTIQKAFVAIGFIIAFGLVENIYRSSLLGLQKQVLFNIISSFVATLRSVGSVMTIIFISPTIEAFFIWQSIISAFSMIFFGIAVYKVIPKIRSKGHFSLTILQSIGRFAGGMIGVTALSLLLMQTDKILLSKLLSLNEYGYYTLAVTVAGGILLLLGPIGQAWFPRFNELHACGNEAGFRKAYHQSSQLISVFVGSVAVILIVFSKIILHLWTQDSTVTANSYTILSLLTIGNLLNGFMWMPYQAQLAYGWTSLTIRINIISVIIIVPMIFLVVPRYGAEGAAWVWVGLNAGYVIIGVHFMYQKILTKEKWQWYIHDILIPIMTASIVASFIFWIIPNNLSFLGELIVLIIASLLVLVSAIIAAPLIRGHVWSYLHHLFFQRHFL